MRSHRWLTLGLALAWAALPGRLDAQAVLENPTLDSAQTAVRDALYRLRDTLTVVNAATSRIARDLNTSSDEVLRSRARNVADRCTSGVGTAADARAVVARHQLPVRDPRKLRDQLTRKLEALEGDLQACQTEFRRLAAPANHEELRGYGVGRGDRVRAATRAYQPAVEEYFKEALGIRYLPNRAGGTPIPSTSGP